MRGRVNGREGFRKQDASPCLSPQPPSSGDTGLISRRAAPGGGAVLVDCSSLGVSSYPCANLVVFPANMHSGGADCTVKRSAATCRNEAERGCPPPLADVHHFVEFTRLLNHLSVTLWPVWFDGAGPPLLPHAATGVLFLKLHSRRFYPSKYNLSSLFRGNAVVIACNRKPKYRLR